MPRWEKKEQNKTKPSRRVVSRYQFLKSEFYRVIKMMSVFRNFLSGKENGVFY